MTTDYRSSSSSANTTSISTIDDNKSTNTNNNATKSKKTAASPPPILRSSVLGFPDYANVPTHSLANPPNEDGQQPLPALVRPPRKTTKAVRKTAFASQFFPSLLHAILTKAEVDGYDHICGWKPHGRSFVVWNRDLFVQRVMPLYFRQSQFASFQRQLNLYGFQRLSRKYLDCFGVYYHPLFLRTRHDLCPAIPRVEKPDAAKPSLPTLTDDDFMKLPSMPPCKKEHFDMANKLALPYQHKRQFEQQQELQHPLELKQQQKDLQNLNQMEHQRDMNQLPERTQQEQAQQKHKQQGKQKRRSSTVPIHAPVTTNMEWLPAARTPNQNGSDAFCPQMFLEPLKQPPTPTRNTTTAALNAFASFYQQQQQHHDAAAKAIPPSTLTRQGGELLEQSTRLIATGSQQRHVFSTQQPSLPTTCANTSKDTTNRASSSSSSSQTFFWPSPIILTTAKKESEPPPQREVFPPQGGVPAFPPLQPTTTGAEGADRSARTIVSQTSSLSYDGTGHYHHHPSSSSRRLLPTPNCSSFSFTAASNGNNASNDDEAAAAESPQDHPPTKMAISDDSMLYASLFTAATEAAEAVDSILKNTTGAVAGDSSAPPVAGSAATTMEAQHSTEQHQQSELHRTVLDDPFEMASFATSKEQHGKQEKDEEYEDTNDQTNNSSDLDEDVEHELLLIDSSWMEPRPIAPRVEALLLQNTQPQAGAGASISNHQHLSTTNFLVGWRDQALAPELLPLFLEPGFGRGGATTPTTTIFFPQEQDQNQQQQEQEREQQQQHEDLDQKPPARKNSPHNSNKNQQDQYYRFCCGRATSGHEPSRRGSS
ncbi:hypothetical protein ACA910_013705 [Epithemia clementina (nom. ined.)]